MSDLAPDCSDGHLKVFSQSRQSPVYDFSVVVDGSIPFLAPVPKKSGADRCLFGSLLLILPRVL
jgi:hypothetical protein